MSPLTRRLTQLSVPAILVLSFLLLLVLGALQYQWAGGLRDADRIRMRATTRALADALARDFDREITRLFLWLQPSLDATAADDSAYADRLDQWRRVAAFPEIIKDLFLIERDREQRVRLLRLETASRTFQPGEWPASLRALRAALDDPARGFGPPDRGPRRGEMDFIVEQIPAVIIPIGAPQRYRDVAPFHVMRPSRILLAVLDIDAIRARVLPTLAQRHFGGEGALQCDLTVVRQADRSFVVWRSDPEARRTSSSDVASGLLDLRFEEATALAPPWSSAPRFAMNHPRGPARAHSEEMGHWLLQVSHRGGSIDERVAAARIRNLGVGFGILALLGTSLALVVISSQRARRLAERQMEFVTGVSHELRTPIAVVCSMTENLADGLVTAPAQVRNYGTLLNAEGRRLAEMVEQVLEFAGSSSVHPTRGAEDLDVADLVDRALQACATPLRDAGFAVARDVDPHVPAVRANPVALQRALQNLIGNAIKHGGDGRWLGLRASVADRGRQVRITVEDHGKGIPASDVAQLFEPFFRGSGALAAQVHGFGLGLALVKRVAEAHGGGVSVASTPGRGSAFTISLPAATSSATVAQEAHADAGTDSHR